MTSQTTTSIFYMRTRIYLLAAFVATISACSGEDESTPANYNVDSNPSQFSVSILNSLKNAISRNNTPDAYAAYHQLNTYLRDYEFTNLDNKLTIPLENKTTSCAGPKINLKGAMSRNGDEQQGLLTFTDFCIDVSDKQKNKFFLVVNGTAEYTVDLAIDPLNSSVTLDYDIIASLDTEKQLYFGEVNIPLFSVANAERVKLYVDAGTVYNTDALAVSGNLDRGYDIRGNIVIGNLGSVNVQTSQPLRYDKTCEGRPIGGKLDIATNQVRFTLEPLDSLCQLKVCSAASGDIVMTCSAF